MISTQLKKRLRLGLALLAAGSIACVAAPVAAQVAYSAAGQEAGAALSQHLRTLATSPRNLAALMGAGKAALELGDAQAAATFYARAEEIAPRDGRIKAGIGAAFLAMEQPQAALKFFDDARALGAPEADYAADRGLAHDLLGNPAQAQRDYELAMRSNDTAELRRRLALSKAISGDRAGALALIEEQLRRQDRSAWRVRAFILALTGDAQAATEAVRAVMPSQAAAMGPFLARLPSLSLTDRAMAVHFGHFPAEMASAQIVPPPRPYTSPPAQTVPQTPAARSQPRASPPASPRSSATPTYAEQRDALRGAGTTRRSTAQPAARQPVQVATAAPLRPTDVPAARPMQNPAPARPPQPRIAEVTPPASTVGPEVVPANDAPTAAPVSALASLGEAIRALPDQEPEAGPARKEPTRKETAAPKAKAPARHWVQIASAPDAAAASEYRRLKRKSPQLLGATSGWRIANRVLVGPFKDKDEAQALVNALAKADIAAVPWTSPEGQEIVKLAAK